MGCGGNVGLTVGILPLEMRRLEATERLKGVSEALRRHLGPAEVVAVNHLINLSGSLPRFLADPLFVSFS